MTLCVDCKHHKYDGGGFWGHFCNAPEARLPQVVDPVDGRVYFHVVGNPSALPDCRQINKGSCTLFEEVS